MSRAKELAGYAGENRLCEEDMYEVETLLNRLHAIESASAEEVREIRERHEKWIAHCGQEALEQNQARRDIATLLAIVHRLGWRELRCRARRRAVLIEYQHAGSYACFIAPVKGKTNDLR